MEKYQIERKKDCYNRRKLIDKYSDKLLSLYIGPQDPSKGRPKVNTSLRGKDVDFSRSDMGVYILGEDTFTFLFHDYTKGFTVQYERGGKVDKNIDAIVTDPYDPKLPEPKKTILTNVIENHLVMIVVKGRVDIKPYIGEDGKQYCDILAPRKRMA